MDDSQPSVTVVIPTTCEARRHLSLRRALDSVASQRGAVARILVVVNGVRRDPACLAELKSRTDVQLIEQDEGNLPMALRRGRAAVRTPYFAFLDDDDEYLPAALTLRLEPLLTDDSLDYVASQGYRYDGAADRPFLTDVTTIHRDPLAALGARNWLASCGGLFRSRSVPVDFFDGVTKYFEWTLLAYRLASTRRMAFVETPTFRIHDSPNSLSKSRDYENAEVDVLNALLRLELPPKVSATIQRRLGGANHSMSDRWRAERNMRLAWKYHLASLRCPGGWRYISYSRKLLGFWSGDGMAQRRIGG